MVNNGLQFCSTMMLMYGRRKVKNGEEEKAPEMRLICKWTKDHHMTLIPLIQYHFIQSEAGISLKEKRAD